MCIYMCVYIYIYIYSVDIGRALEARRRQTCHFRKRATSAPAEGPAYRLDVARRRGEFPLGALRARKWRVHRSRLAQWCYIYIYIYMYVYTYMHIHIYVYIEREI